MYSIVETIGPGTSGLSQTGATQSAMSKHLSIINTSSVFAEIVCLLISVMYDLSSYSPAYPHARYGHSTALLTDNYLLLFGGCLRYLETDCDWQNSLSFCLFYHFSLVVMVKVALARPKIHGCYILTEAIGNDWVNVQRLKRVLP